MQSLRVTPRVPAMHADRLAPAGTGWDRRQAAAAAAPTLYFATALLLFLKAPPRPFINAVRYSTAHS